MPTNEFIISWLNDAYAMENQIVPTLEEHLKDIQENHTLNEKFPEMREKIGEHITKTKQHAEKVKSCIERLGGSVSAIKSTAVSVMGEVAGKAADMAKDAIVKNVLAEYTTEHMEIASYGALVTAAQELGDEQTARVCEEILGEEEEMQGWLADQMPSVIEEFLRLQE